MLNTDRNFKFIYYALYISDRTQLVYLAYNIISIKYKLIVIITKMIFLDCIRVVHKRYFHWAFGYLSKIHHLLWSRALNKNVLSIKNIFSRSCVSLSRANVVVGGWESSSWSRSSRNFHPARHHSKMSEQKYKIPQFSQDIN